MDSWGNAGAVGKDWQHRYGFTRTNGGKELANGNAQSRLPKGPLHGNSHERSMQKQSHEIRSVTQGLLGYLAIFSEETKKSLSEDQTELLERINKFASKLADMVTELLEATKSED